MTKEQAIEDLKRLQAVGRGDPEAAHSDADKVLCMLLESFGCVDVVHEWERVARWYA